MEPETRSSEAALGSARYAHDPSSWNATWGRGRKRAILLTVQLLGEAAIAAMAVVIAYVMHFRWPASMGTIDRDIIDTFPLLLRVLRTPEFNPYVPLFLLSPVAHLLVFRWLRLYGRQTRDKRPFGAAFSQFKGVLLATAMMMILAYAYGATLSPQAAELAPIFFLYQGLLALFGLVLFRSALLIGVLSLHAAGFGLTRIALIHAGERPEQLAAALDSPATGCLLVGDILTSGASGGTASQSGGGLGSLDNLHECVNSHGLDEVILAIDPASLSIEQRLGVAETCWRMGVSLKMVTPFRAFFQTKAEPEMVGEIPLLHVQNLGIYARLPQLLKRAMDLAVSFTVLALTSPLLLLTAILIKLDSPGPVFFVQERVGLNGRTFRILKFRSMRTDGDTAAHKAYLQQMIRNGAAHQEDENGNPIFKIADDPRVTRVGRFIRKTSLDELPQLFNVLQGDMSLVGPRPPIQYEVDEYQDWHLKRLHIRPGITGLWQVSGRNRLSFEQMVQLDIDYIERWSLWFDIKILLRTIPVVLNLEQAF